MWSYKFAVMLNHIPFLDHMSEAALESVSKIFAATAVAAGIPNDVRDIVCKTAYPSINSFLQDCTSLCPKPGTQARHATPHPFQSDNHRPQPFHYSNNHGNQTHRQRYGNDQSHFRQSYTSHTPYGNTSHSQHRTPLLANPQSQRDTSTVTCFRCNKVGHYANNCPNGNTQSQRSNHSQPQMPSQPQPHTVNQHPQSQQQVQPARNSQPARPIRKIDHSSPTTNVTDTDILNTHDSEDESFITQGEVNGIFTDIIIDSGARVSLISSDFISPDMSPVGTVTLFGISQVNVTASIYEIEVVLPTMKGKCRLAMDDRLPPHTFLLGVDFGKQKLLDLMSQVKATPVPVMAVTRAMAADNALADKIADTLHLSEGATPLALDVIPYVHDLDTPTYTPSVTHTDIPDDTHCHITCHTPNIMSPVPHSAAAIPQAASHTSQSLVPVTFPPVTFDGVTKDEFLDMQKADKSLAPLWEAAKDPYNSCYVAKGFLMCLTTTCNQVSSALIVPQPLGSKVLSIAHDGLGHGGLNATRSLINKHFSWPNMAADVKGYIS